MSFSLFLSIYFPLLVVPRIWVPLLDDAMSQFIYWVVSVWISPLGLFCSAITGDQSCTISIQFFSCRNVASSQLLCVALSQGSRRALWATPSMWGLGPCRTIIICPPLLRNPWPSVILNSTKKCKKAEHFYSLRNAFSSLHLTSKCLLCDLDF